MKKRKKWPLDRSEVYTSGSIKRSPKRQEALNKSQNPEEETSARKYTLDGNKPTKKVRKKGFKKHEEGEE